MTVLWHWDSGYYQFADKIQCLYCLLMSDLEVTRPMRRILVILKFWQTGFQMPINKGFHDTSRKF